MQGRIVFATGNAGKVKEIQMIKPNLTDIIMQLKGEGEDELN